MSASSGFSLRASVSELSDMLGCTERIRNICILAHVDHGKTTLSDSLVCANGFISNKLAGKLRFLDSMEDEQKRGITMHTSAITLLYRSQERRAGEEASAPLSTVNYLVNLVDSPGHIDFSSDVSTATRLCDGALIIVDVLEGICTQTHAVLYKALKERMTPCLVLNKIDRLALELQLTPVEALHHIRRIIENVNALAFTLLTSESLILETKKEEDAAAGTSTASHGDGGITETLVEEWNFAPEKGNIVFSSALDCWGFGTLKFAALWSKKLGVNPKILNKYMFEDYYLNPETKKIVKCDPDDPSNVPMFASLILEPIWQLYNAAITEKDSQKAAAIALSELNISLTPREINSKDQRGTLQTIFQKWIPLSEAVLKMVVRNIPDPRSAQKRKMTTLFAPSDEDALTEADIENASPESTRVALKSMKACKDAVSNCVVLGSGEDGASPVVVYISKMTPVKITDLAPEDQAMVRAQREAATSDAPSGAGSGEGAKGKDETDVLMALGRVFAGELRRDSSFYTLGHRHQPLGLLNESGEVLEENLAKHNVSRVDGANLGLYLCFGPSFKSVASMPAGNIVGIIGLDRYVQKTGTMSSTYFCPPMRSITFQAKPILRVAVEPIRPQDLPALEKGIQALYQYDPVVEVSVESTGQFTISCLGELHLELCLKALSERFAKCEVRVSEPLVPFRETVSNFTEELGGAGENEATNNTADKAGTGALISDIKMTEYLPPPWCDTPNLDKVSNGVYRMSSAGGALGITLACGAMPSALTRYLVDLQVEDTNQGLQLNGASEQVALSSPLTHLVHALTNGLDLSSHGHDGMKKSAEIWAHMKKIVSESQWDTSAQALHPRQVVCFGPDQVGPNMLLLSRSVKLRVWKSSDALKALGSEDINKAEHEAQNIIATLVPFSTAVAESSTRQATETSTFFQIWSRMLRPSLVSGFQLATASGPLMQEPLQGVCYFVNNIDLAISELPRDLIEVLSSNSLISPEASSEALAQGATPSLVAGVLIPDVRDALRVTMLGSPVRVVEPVFSCSVQCDQSQLGNLYAVLSKRRGDVTSEDVIEGTNLFVLAAFLPVASSFGFAMELLKKTSGNAVTPQLIFSHWSTMALDPFWRPTTQEELEDLGGQAVAPNNARTYINDVRRRKGLPLEEKVVVSAEKQRNLTKNK